MKRALLLLAVAASVTAPISATRKNEAIPIKKAPYKVLVLLNSGRSVVLGSGAILNAKWAITTAATVHAHRRTPHSLLVRSGSGKRNIGGGLHVVGKIVVHPEFGDGHTACMGKGDLALLRLVNSFKLSLTVAPIPLPMRVTPQDVAVNLVGWPMVNGRRLRQLIALGASTTDWIECNRAFEKSGIILDLRTTCTDKPAYQGEEGDALVSEATLTGLYKKTNFHESSSPPQLYIDIASYRTWIEREISKD